MVSDPKPTRRTKDTDLMRLMHADPRKECCITGATDHLELHHVLARSQGGDDTRANLVWLHRDVHHRITANDPVTCSLLGEHLWAARLDTVAYLTMKFGGTVGAADWMRRRLHIYE